MSRTKHAFKETDVSRALRAVQKAGMNASSVKITKAGEIEVEITGRPQAQDSPPASEWTDWTPTDDKTAA